MSGDNWTPERLRRALELLAQPAPYKGRSDLWDAVVREFPLTPHEAEPNSAGEPRALTDWLWATTDMVKSGWLTKDNRGGWSITSAGHEALREHPEPSEFRARASAGYTAWQKERQEALGRGIVPGDDGQEVVVRTSRIFVERGMSQLGSVFAPGRHVWRPDVTRQLVEHFVRSTGRPGATFVENLGQQLAVVDDDARLLMAELVTLQLLPASTETIGAAKKAERVEAILGLMEHPVEIPDEIREAFGSGAYNLGTAMATNLGRAMSIVVATVDAWVQLDDDARTYLLGDPWAFRDFLFGIPGESFASQRLSLMYLVHPDTFVGVVQAEAREKIRTAFLGEIGESSGDLDRDLRDIQIALQVKNKHRIHFWLPELYAKWHGSDQGTVVSVADAETSDETQAPPAALTFPPATMELADALLLPQPWLQDVLDIVERRRQVILYGPPGTGKTYLAKALARHAAGGAEPMIVQFHPSYSYEDFVAGYRPVTEDGALTYRLKRGPLLRLADDAARNPEQAHFLVIDEINRGNLAKVFGELYFLLEYRGESIELLYGNADDEETRFAFPSNVFLLGTMNSQDRSIALLDTAMRRRFAFVELHPDEEPTAGLLRAWLKRFGLPGEPATLLDTLNASIHDRDARIGPSYLMPADHDLSEERLRQVWRYEILPLLEETHFGDGRDITKEYGLDALRERARRTAASGMDAGRAAAIGDAGNADGS